MKLFSTWPIRLAALAGLLAVAGCVQHVWAPGPDAHGTFAEQSARCRLMARADERGYIAFGSSSYVAGAAIGNAIGNAVRAQADFNDCMAASGWLAVDAAPASAEATAAGAPSSDPPSPSGSDNRQLRGGSRQGVGWTTTMQGTGAGAATFYPAAGIASAP